MKEVLTSDAIVSFFDSSLGTEVLTDASRLKVLGFAMIQRKGQKTLLISCGSRSLTGTESGYATIELECLAIQFAIGKCRHYLLGMPHFSVMTDHKPLVGVFSHRIDETVNPRLLRMREKLTPYSFEVIWVRGKNPPHCRRPQPQPNLRSSRG